MSVTIQLKTFTVKSSPVGTDIIYLGDSANSFDEVQSTIAQVFAAVPGLASSAQVQQASFNVGVDTGIADAYIVNLNPAVASLTNGLIVAFTPIHNNVTTTPTLVVNGSAAKTIVLSNGAVQAGDIATTMISYCIYSVAATAFVLLTPAIS